MIEADKDLFSFWGLKISLFFSRKAKNPSIFGLNNLNIELKEIIQFNFVLESHFIEIKKTSLERKWHFTKHNGKNLILHSTYIFQYITIIASATSLSWKITSRKHLLSNQSSHNSKLSHFCHTNLRETLQRIMFLPLIVKTDFNWGKNCKEFHCITKVCQNTGTVFQQKKTLHKD